MTKDIDLLPWILGALTLAIVAAAVAVGTTHRSAAGVSQDSIQTPVPALPAVAAIETLPPSPAVEPAAPPEPAQAAVAPPVPSGQIWECTINGQKTFSGKPCGDKATLRDVGPVNVMNATPIARSGRIYQADANYSPDYTASDYSYPDTQEAGNNSNPVYIGIPYAVRMRPERPHHPNVRDHVTAPHAGPPGKNH